MPGWRSVKNLDGYGLGRKIHAAGWTIFCLAYDTKATVFGIDGEKMARRAIERILASRTPEKFNSLEIVRVASFTSEAFLGNPPRNCRRPCNHGIFRRAPLSSKSKTNTSSGDSHRNELLHQASD